MLVKLCRIGVLLQVACSTPQHNLINSCPTRWGSLYKCVERFIEQEPAIRSVLLKDKSATRLVLEPEQLEQLQTLLDVLGPLYPLTDMLSGEIWRMACCVQDGYFNRSLHQITSVGISMCLGEKSATISSVLPVLDIIRRFMATKEGEATLSITMKTAVITYLNKEIRHPAHLPFFEKAAFLDPRFKAKYGSEESYAALLDETREASGECEYSTLNRYAWRTSLLHFGCPSIRVPISRVTVNFASQYNATFPRVGPCSRYSL